MRSTLTLRLIFLASCTSFIILWLSLPPAPRKYLQSHGLRQPESRLLPYKYWYHRNLYPENYRDDTCVEFPDFEDILYASASWQLLQVENGNVYVYGAYWDDRFEPLVRVLVYSDVHPLPKLYCQLWYPNDNEPQLEVAIPLYAWRTQWGGPLPGVNEPYILSCSGRRHSPEPQVAPVAAAVVTTPCGAVTNVVRVQNAPSESLLGSVQPEAGSRRNNSVAVCVKWIHFREDISSKLIEWLQLLKQMDAEKVFLYTIKLHPKTVKVLDHYEASGFVVATDLSHAPQMSGRQLSPTLMEFLDMRRELVTLNDCLYRNLGKYEWIAIIDVDEMIVPYTTNSWPDLIQSELASAASEGALPLDALVFANFYITADSQRDLVGPARLPMMAFTWRNKEHSPWGWRVKSFMNTSSMIAAHNHIPISCDRDCVMRNVKTEVGKLLHFRRTCSEEGAECEKEREIIRDDTFGRWRERMVKEIEEIERIVGV